MILLRADASKEIGGGHFFRCLAIASFATDAALVVRFDLGEGFRAHAERAGVSLIEVGSDDMAELAALEADVIVLDGYQYDATHVAALRESFGGKIAMIDDNGDRTIGGVDYLVNPNIHAPDVEYAWSDETVYLLGPRYALLRPMFAARRSEELPRDPWRIFVCVGGSDPTGSTGKVLEALAGAGFELDVVVGPGTEAGEGWGVDVELHRNLQDPTALMATASLAVTAAGGMTWELACLGTPNLQIATADNQVPLAERMDALGATKLLGRAKDVEQPQIRQAVEALFADEDRREAMSLAGRALIDGRGAERVARALEGGGDELRVRDARLHDSRNYWLINNHPSVRKNALSIEPISWESHTGWFAQRLQDSSCRLMVAEVDGAIAGALRFDDIDRREAVITVALDPACRGRGIGTKVIRVGTELLLTSTNLQAVAAYVRLDNEASLTAFLKAGYQLEARDEVREGVALKRLLRRAE